MTTIQKLVSVVAIATPLAILAAVGSNSGLKKGETVFAFEPTHVTGPDAGTNTCPVCKYGATPAVQVWVNGDSNANVAKIAKNLESSIASRGTEKLKAFVVFVKPANVSDADEKAALAEMSEKNGLKNVALTYVAQGDDSIGMYKIAISPSVKNTVLVYANRKVTTNFVNLKADGQGLKALDQAVKTNAQ